MELSPKLNEAMQYDIFGNGIEAAFARVVEYYSTLQQFVIC